MKLELEHLPKNWEIKKLGEVCTYSKGKKPKILSSEKSEINSIPYINIKAFEKGIFDEYTDGEKCNLCEEGDLLMVWDGARAGFTGKAKKGAIGSTLMKINAVEGVEKNYIYYFLVSLYKKLNTNPRGVGIPHVEPTLLWNSGLVIPPLPEQQAIVQKIEELFSELDKSIENLKTAQQQIKIYRQSVLKSAFEGKLTSKKEDENLMMVAEPNLEYGDNKLPGGWKWNFIGDLTISFDGKRIPLSKEVRAKRKGNFRYYGATTIVDYIDDFIFDGKYILIGEDGANLLSKSKPLSFIVEGKFWVNNHAHILQTKEILNLEYFNYYFNSLNLNEFITGTAQPKLTQNNLKKIKIPFPELFEQIEIVNELDSRFSVADKLEESINQSLLQAETLRQSILKRAFEGKLI